VSLSCHNCISSLATRSQSGFLECRGPFCFEQLCTYGSNHPSPAHCCRCTSKQFAVATYCLKSTGVFELQMVLFCLFIVLKLDTRSSFFLRLFIRFIFRVFIEVFFIARAYVVKIPNVQSFVLLTLYKLL